MFSENFQRSRSTKSSKKKFKSFFFCSFFPCVCSNCENQQQKKNFLNTIGSCNSRLFPFLFPFGRRILGSIRKASKILRNPESLPVYARILTRILFFLLTKLLNILWDLLYEKKRKKTGWGYGKIWIARCCCLFEFLNLRTRRSQTKKKKLARRRWKEDDSRGRKNFEQ